MNVDQAGEVPLGTQLVDPTADVAREAGARQARREVGDAAVAHGATGGGSPLPDALVAEPAAGPSALRAPLGPTVSKAIEEGAGRAANVPSVGSFGRAGGTPGVDISGLAFDPEGADFAEWVSRLGDELRRNYVAPQTAIFGFSGTLVVGFVVERDGAVSALGTLQSTGTRSLDRSVLNAIASSRFLPLPDDYRPAQLRCRLTMTFR